MKEMKLGLDFCVYRCMYMYRMVGLIRRRWCVCIDVMGAELGYKKGLKI